MLKVIDPTIVELYEQKGAITLRNGDTRSVWNLFVNDRSGDCTMIRLANRYRGEAAKKNIDAIIQKCGN